MIASELALHDRKQVVSPPPGRLENFTVAGSRNLRLGETLPRTKGEIEMRVLRSAAVAVLLASVTPTFAVDPRAGRLEPAAIAHAYSAYVNSYVVQLSSADADAASAFQNAYYAYANITWAWSVAFDQYLTGAIPKSSYEYFLAAASNYSYQGYLKGYAAYLRGPTTAGAAAFYGHYYSQNACRAAWVQGAPIPAAPALSADLTAMLNLHNGRRAALGLQALQVDARLMRSATKHAAYMAAINTMTHEEYDPARATALLRAAAEGYSGGSYGVGENVAYGYLTYETTRLFNDWVNSPGHRANIDYSAFTHVGLAVATSSSGVPYWCIDFGYVFP